MEPIVVLLVGSWGIYEWFHFINFDSLTTLNGLRAQQNDFYALPMHPIVLPVQYKWLWLLQCAH